MDNKTCNYTAKEVLQNLCDLLDQPLSIVHERNLYLLEKYLSILRTSQRTGLYIDEINCVCKVLTVLINYIHEIASYKPLFLTIVKYMATPILIHKPTDESTFKNDYINYYNVIGFLLSYGKDEDVQFISLTSVILAISYNYTNTQEFHGYYLVSSKCTREAIENSFFPGIVVHLMEISSYTVFPYYLQLAILLIHKSSIVCQTMAQFGVISICILKMYSEDELKEDISIPQKRDEIINYDNLYVPYMEQLTTFLWGILMGLRQIPKNEIHEINSPGISQMWCLRYILRKTVLKGNNQSTRNDIMGIILLIISMFHDTRIVEAGLSEDIALLSIVTEMKNKITWLKNLKFEASNDDLKFKQMAILITCYCLKDAAQILILKHYQILTNYLSIINSHFEPVDIPWSICQQKLLLITVLRALTILVPICLDEFIRKNGFHQILMLLERFKMRPYDIDTLYTVCKTLNIILKTKDKNFIQHMRSQNSSDTLISLCEYILEHYTLSRLNQRILSFLFNILEASLSYYPDIQSYPANESLDLSLNVLNRFLKPHIHDAPISNKLIMCLGGFIWEGIAWTPKNLKEFINAGGVYYLLDVIEKGIFPVKMLYLGILVDFLDEGSCISHIVTWRGGPNKCISLISMLLSIYRIEEKRIRVQRQKNGCIFDGNFPIMGEEQWYETFLVKNDTKSSPAIVDLLISTRPKIYAIIHMIRERYAETIKIANEHYKTYNENLLYNDQITMVIAGNFFALKLSEIWEEVRRDLQMAGINPLAIDFNNLNVLIIRHRKWMNHLVESQSSILNKYKNVGIKEFNDMWKLLRDNTLQTALEGLKEMDLELRTSDIRFRHSRKKSQIEQTNEIERKITDDLKITLPRNLDVQSVFNLKIHLNMDK